jgi:two-component system chemotaxis sensor kinase CheA
MSEELDLTQAFTEEAGELLQSFEEGLLELEARPGDPEVLNRIFRAAHTIKGNSAMLGFTDIAQFTHSLENVLDRLRKGTLQVTPPGMTLLLQSMDMVKGMLARLGQPGQAAQDAAPLIAALQRYAEGETPAAAPDAERREGREPPQGPRATVGPEVAASRAPEAGAAEPPGLPAPAEVESKEEGPPKLGDILLAENVITQEDVDAALKKQRRVEEILVEDKLITSEQLSEALGKQKRFGEILVEENRLTSDQLMHALGKQAVAPSRADAATIRVQTEKVDRLINLVGEMVISQSIVSQIMAKFGEEQLPRLIDAVAELEHNSRELQQRVMAIRMVPIRTVFGRIPRLVRDLASHFGKKIALAINGEETELDKTMVERIGDPLVHLVRNAVDHGIEGPAIRLARGKPEQGTIRLSASHESGMIVIRITDDGTGLDRERILRKAIQQGLASEQDKLTDEQVYQLIFAAGLSTAERITDVSGRGVGMDVVRRNVEGLGGSVGIQSTSGQGSTFAIKLPLTLAILDGMLVQVGEQTYILPLVNITESLRPVRSQIVVIANRGEVVNVRGRALPILRLHRLFGVTPRRSDPCEGLLVIVEHAEGRFAILVDDLLGQRQVVIKSLEANYHRIVGTSGATIMGDGRVALILDVPGLLRLVDGRAALGQAA